MKKTSIMKLLVALILIINLIGPGFNINLMNFLPFLILLIVSIPFLLGHYKFSIPLAIMLFIYTVGHLFNMLVLHSKPYYDIHYPLSYLLLLTPVIEFGTGFLIVKSFVRNSNKLKLKVS